LVFWFRSWEKHLNDTLIHFGPEWERGLGTGEVAWSDPLDRHAGVLAGSAVGRTYAGTTAGMAS
jgi:hypothetical protein